MRWRAFWAKRFPLELLIGKRFFVPNNLNIWYVFGAILVLSLVVQVLSGIWLTLFYLPNDAFASIQHLSRQVPFGWLLRNLHTTGASAIFILVYLHLFRGLLYRSYQSPREVVWLLGVVLFWLLLAEAFSGYLLPFGQMSYWGATVITNMLASLPGGDVLLTWLRGDYVVSSVTVQRFFAAHIILLPLLLFWVIRLHIKALHHVGSGNPSTRVIDTRGDSPKGCVAFYPTQVKKEFLAWLIYLLLFCAVMFFVPRGWGLLQDALNEQPANPWQTPIDIKPLWYMAPYYALLRAIPSKVGGVFAVSLSLLSLVLIPWLSLLMHRFVFKPALKSRWRLLFLTIAVACFIGLSILGMLNLYAWLSVVTLVFVIIGSVALLFGL